MVTSRVPIILVGATMAPLTVWSITYLQLFWRRIRMTAGYEAALADLQQREERLRREQEEVYQIRLNMLDAQTVIDDGVARLQHFADPVIVEAVADCSTKINLTPYQQRVAIEAAIWAPAMREGASWIPWAGIRRQIAAAELQYPQKLQSQLELVHIFTVETLRVVLLALGTRHLPDAMLVPAGLSGWRRRAAALLRYSLRTRGYDQTALLERHAH
jgi:hypothetical protein